QAFQSDGVVRELIDGHPRDLGLEVGAVVLHLGKDRAASKAPRDGTHDGAFESNHFSARDTRIDPTNWFAAAVQQFSSPGFPRSSISTSAGGEHRDDDPLTCIGRQLNRNLPHLLATELASRNFNNGVEGGPIIVNFTGDWEPGRFMNGGFVPG